MFRLFPAGFPYIFNLKIFNSLCVQPIYHTKRISLRNIFKGSISDIFVSLGHKNVYLKRIFKLFTLLKCVSQFSKSENESFKNVM